MSYSCGVNVLQVASSGFVTEKVSTIYHIHVHVHCVSLSFTLYVHKGSVYVYLQQLIPEVIHLQCIHLLACYNLTHPVVHVTCAALKMNVILMWCDPLQVATLGLVTPWW